MSQLPPDAWQHLLRVTEDCVGCGICQTCLACIHACPHRAIQLTVPEKNPQARYRNEHISLQEIIQANHQA